MKAEAERLKVAHEPDARSKADPDGNGEHARSLELPASPAEAKNLPEHKSSSGEPAPGIERDSLVGRAGYKNRGAVGYGSPIERAHEDVSFALAEDAELDSSKIVVVAEGGSVVLRGSVTTMADKARAFACAVAAVRSCPIRNELAVRTARRGK